jgi:acetate---CoA ligase (ADP-forming)
VIFGGAHGAGQVPDGGPAVPSLRQRLAAIARSAGLELCGAGCMGFANIGYGLRAMGYIEPDPLPAGPVALVSHSGSVFSALLRARRAIGFTLAVSSGQELVTAAPGYLRYAIEQPQTRVLALVLEAIRQPGELRQVLAAAARRGMPVVLLTAGTSASGRAMVAAHSGALAGADGSWEALARAYGVHRVGDLAELADTLELFAARTRLRARAQPGPPCRSGGPTHGNTPQSWPGAPPRNLTGGRGIATVHDSGLERAHAADLADALGVPFAAIGEATKARLAELLDPGLIPANPLDVWGTGAGTRELFAGCLTALAQDDAVAAVALAVDLVPELDGDESYPLAALDAAGSTGKPVAVIASLPCALDTRAAALLRDNAIPVLEGMRPGLLALRHLLDHEAAARRAAGHLTAGQRHAPSPAGAPDLARLARARRLLAAAGQGAIGQLALLREYGIATVAAERVTDAAAAAAAASRLGYPVVLKTDEPAVAHKTDVGGVILRIGTPGQLADAYADLASRLGPAALVCATAPAGVELALGVVSDDALGPLIVVGAGGTLTELVADRAVALPPLSQYQAASLLSGLRVRRLLDGVRGAPPADLAAICRAICALAELATDLAGSLDALDINPLICHPAGAVAADVLVAGPR